MTAWCRTAHPQLVVKDDIGKGVDEVVTQVQELWDGAIGHEIMVSTTRGCQPKNQARYKFYNCTWTFFRVCRSPYLSMPKLLSSTACECVCERDSPPRHTHLSAHGNTKLSCSTQRGHPHPIDNLDRFEVQVGLHLATSNGDAGGGLRT